MDNILWKISAIILAVILVFIVPILMFYDRIDAITYNTAYDAVNEFVDTSRQLGEVNSYNYDKFISKLNSTGLIYDIDVEHYKKVYLPILDNNGVETGDVTSVYQAVCNADVLSEIYDKAYMLEAGDMLYIRILNKSHSMGEVIRSRVLGINASEGSVYIRSGGMVYSSGVE